MTKAPVRKELLVLTTTAKTGKNIENLFRVAAKFIIENPRDPMGCLENERTPLLRKNPSQIKYSCCS